MNPRPCPKWILIGLLAIGFWLFLMLASLSSPGYAADGSSIGESRLKAAFLYNFAKFTEWPSAAFVDHQASHIFCIMGEDPFGVEIDRLTDKLITDRQLVIKRLHFNDQTLGCNLLYVSRTEIHHAARILHTLQKAPVLTICDSDGCAETGFMINMRMVNSRIQLDLNLDAVQCTELKLSSQLIKIAHLVKRNQ